MEVLAPVTFTPEQVKRIVKTTGGCLIWGGGLSIAPADDLIIRVSKPLSLEPYDKMISSVLAKKVAMGVKYLVIDVPYGPGTKVPNRTVAKSIEERFQIVGKAFGMTVHVKFDSAFQPIGSGVGPAVEARDVLRVLQQKKDRPHDLESKAIGLAAELLEMSDACPKGEGKARATEALQSGQAWKKMQQIIHAQGGKAKIDSEDLLTNAISSTIHAKKRGLVTHIGNRAIDDVARTLGAPDHKLGGLYLHRKIGQHVEVGDPLITLYSHSTERLTLAKRSDSLRNILQIR